MQIVLRACQAILILAAASGIADAQSLAEVARKEQERRKTIKVSSKVYTNDDLAPPQPQRTEQISDTDMPPDRAATGGQEAAGTANPPPSRPPEPEKPASPRRDEKYWRARIGEARAALARDEIFLEALQSRINALTADFTARDDPAQRAVIASDRQKALAELERVRAEIRQITTDIAEIEEEARRAGVPPGWLR
jgi:hypothetical protein